MQKKQTKKDTIKKEDKTLKKVKTKESTPIKPKTTKVKVLKSDKQKPTKKTSSVKQATTKTQKTTTKNKQLPKIDAINIVDKDANSVVEQKITSNVMDELIKKHGVELKSFRQGELIEGIVVSISNSKILLDIGAKAEGVVKKEQMNDSEKSYKKLKLGDKILVMVERDENKQGFVELSIKKAETERKWKDFDDMFKNQIAFEVTALQYNKGGLICDAYGMQGFVPISHLDSSRFAEVSTHAKGSEKDIAERMAPLIGKELKVVIIELDRAQNRLVLSEKQVDAAKNKEARDERLEEIKVGSTIKGLVSGVVPFGLFVDLNGVEGLVHVSEIAWEKVENPSTYYTLGDKIEALVLDIDRNKGKVGLSLKRLKENPWESVAAKYPENTKITGKVTRLVPFGAFIELEPGLEGLVHISEMAEPLKEGDTIDALVTLVDAKEQRLGLSTRRTKEVQIYR